MERYSPLLWFRGCAAAAGATSAATAGPALARPRPGSFPPLDPRLLPAVSLFHGGADHCVPPASSLAFAAELQAAGVQAEAIIFKGAIRSIAGSWCRPVVLHTSFSAVQASPTRTPCWRIHWAAPSRCLKQCLKSCGATIARWAATAMWVTVQRNCASLWRLRRDSWFHGPCWQLHAG